MVVSERTYEQLALEDDDIQWELVCGRLVAKPAMTTRHNEIPRTLVRLLIPVLPAADYSLAEGTPRLRVVSGTYRVPDLVVIPRHVVQRQEAERPTDLEMYDDPLPFVVEVWLPSTGEYDVDRKLPEYQQRGDLEIWRIHPLDRTITAWRRQPDGSYSETLYRDGPVPVVSLPAITIELAAIFE